jgi:hypothetical protein
MMFGAFFMQKAKLSQTPSLLARGKRWHDPVKGQSPRPETLAIVGDFDKFTAHMKRIFRSPAMGTHKA